MGNGISKVVLKFGGTSLAGSCRLRAAATIVDGTASRSTVAVVVSAMAGVTGNLVRLADRASSGGEVELEALARRHRATLAALGGGVPRMAPALEQRLLELERLLGRVAASGHCGGYTRARILAAGERLSAILMAAALRELGRRAVVIDGSELVVTDVGCPARISHELPAAGEDLPAIAALLPATPHATCPEHASATSWPTTHTDRYLRAHATKVCENCVLEAEVDLAATCDRVRRRLARLEPGTIPVITGFLGADRMGRTTLLGRGGSDLSAALIARGAGARRLEIWTDVPGVLSASPRWVPEAATVARLSRGEASALARWGGTVLHPKTLTPLMNTATTVVVASSLDPRGGRTVIDTGTRSPRPVAISGREGVAVVPTRGCGRQVLDPLDGRFRGEMVESGGGNAAGLDLAVVALIGGDWETVVDERIRALRLPVLGVVPELERDAIGLIVRAHLMRRTVKALHDSVLQPPGASTGVRLQCVRLREAS